ncbi:hypothetical protein CWIS_15645, partial [Cellulomonas sp. A375-1]
GVGELVGGRGVGVALEIGVACGVLAVVSVVVARLVRGRAAQRSSQRVRDEGRAAIEEVARRDLVQPAAEVVAEHRRVRGLLEAARG